MGRNSRARYERRCARNPNTKFATKPVSYQVQQVSSVVALGGTAGLVGLFSRLDLVADAKSIFFGPGWIVSAANGLIAVMGLVNFIRLVKDYRAYKGTLEEQSSLKADSRVSSLSSKQKGILLELMGQGVSTVVTAAFSIALAVTFGLSKAPSEIQQEDTAINNWIFTLGFGGLFVSDVIGSVITMLKSDASAAEKALSVTKGILKLGATVGLGVGLFAAQPIALLVAAGAVGIDTVVHIIEAIYQSCVSSTASIGVTSAALTA